MAVKPVSVLKTYFERRDKPTQAQFYDLLDTLQDALNRANAAQSTANEVVNTPVDPATSTALGLVKTDRTQTPAPVVATTDYVDEAVAGVSTPSVSLATATVYGVARTDRSLLEPIVATTNYVDESIASALGGLDMWILRSDDGNNYAVSLVTDTDGVTTFSVDQAPTMVAPLPPEFSLLSNDGNRYPVSLTTNVASGVTTLRVDQDPI